MTVPTPPAPEAPGATPAPGGGGDQKALGLASMIVGIVSIPLACCPLLGIPAGIVAVVLGFMGKKKAEQGLASNRGQAMAGIICGFVGGGLGIISSILGAVLQLNTLPNL